MNHGTGKDHFLSKLFPACFCGWRSFRCVLLDCTLVLWHAYTPWLIERFKLNEKDLGALTLNFFANVRIVIVFFFLVPALALHWSAKKT